MSAAEARFREAYAEHRAAEGRGYRGADLFALPYLTTGRFARQWAVRARSFDAFLNYVVVPAAVEARRPLDILDIGAGNGWLSRQLGRQGHRAVALDIRDDAVDGLGAAEPFLRENGSILQRVAGSFDALPLRDRSFDIAIFNASLHYATDLRIVLAEAAEVVRPGGALVVLDSPFYGREKDGVAMTREKHGASVARFGARADILLSVPFIEFLTEKRLADASTGLRLEWRRRRVRYPVWYELRPLVARLRGRRQPSRFDLWVSKVP